MKHRKTLLSFAGVGLLVLGLLALAGDFFTSPLSVHARITTVRPGAQPKAGPQMADRPLVRQVSTVPQEYGRGLFRIEYSEYETAALTKQFPTFSVWMEPGYTDDGEIQPDFPPSINVADMRIPSKNLRLAAVTSQYRNWCENGYCPLELYVQKSGGWESVFSKTVSSNQYLLIADDSVSLILCRPGRHGYIQYRLTDGRLERSITVNDGEYFAPVGPFANPALASCN